MKVFYFSATGNSLYIAKELDKDAISIPQALKGGMNYSDDAIGIVYPDYGSEMPGMVKEFIEKATLTSQYFFLIITYGANKGESVDFALEEIKKKNIRADYIRSILMVDNYLPAFDMKKEKEIDKKIPAALKEIKEDIKERRKFIEETNEGEKGVYKNYLALVTAHPEFSWKNIEFYVTDDCIACSTCSKVCPSKSIIIENGKAKHTYENCQKCLSCINLCPKNAIRIKTGEVNERERYLNEHVKISDLINANG